MSSEHEATGVRLRLYQSEPHPCPYLANRTATDQYTVAGQIDPFDFQILMDNGFRRSGRIIYRPRCVGCSECIPIRVPVDRFLPSRSQRRAIRRNADVEVDVGRPVSTDEKWRIYQAYLEDQHETRPGGNRESFERFLYESPTMTLEMTYRVGGRIGGIGIVDVTPACLSSVYFYFDPEFRKRRFGVLSALYEIQECQRQNLPYWYAGYYVRDCAQMKYKAEYRPFELLGADGHWHPQEP